MNWFGHKQQKPEITLLTKKGDITGLIQALTYDDFEIQIEAAKSIESLGPDAIGILLKKIKTNNRTMRLGIIEALAVIKDPRAVDSLLEIMGDRDAEVRRRCFVLGFFVRIVCEIDDNESRHDRCRALVRKKMRDPGLARHHHHLVHTALRAYTRLRANQIAIGDKI